MAWGESDDPSSPHYADQTALLSSGQLHSTYFNLDELLPVAESRLLYRAGPQRVRR
jgi:acyl-homoserine lactone acylase PvdQ